MTDKTIDLPAFVKKTKLSRGVVCKRLRLLIEQGKVKSGGVKAGDGTRARWEFPTARVPSLVKLLHEMDKERTPQKAAKRAKKATPRARKKPARRRVAKPAPEQPASAQT
jgi:hypothetical protein